MDEDWYDFSEELSSIGWINELPKGLVSEKINLNHNSIEVLNTDEGYNIYIGPKDPSVGGDAIVINLDKETKLLDYSIKRLMQMRSVDNDN